MRLRVAAALVLCLTVAGCANEADEALQETTDRLGELRSGRLSMTLVVSPGVEGADIGFELEGPFALPQRPGELPQTDLRYTQIAGTQRGDVGFISDRDGAWVEVDGQAYELPADRVEGLRGSGGDDGEGPLGELDVASWTKDEQLEEGAPMDGEETDRVRADIDVVKALNDVIATAGELGGDRVIEGLEPIEGSDAEDLERAVRAAPLKVVTGKDDRLLRHLRLDLDIGLEAPRELAGGLGQLRGAQVTFELRIVDPNGPVRIEEPDDALPYSSLPSG